MTPTRIPRRVTTALLNSLSAGVVPRVGLPHIAVGRKYEIEALLSDLQSIGEGGASFRFIVGRYGSGKSFLLQLLRNHASEREFVVADVDLSPERRLVGTGGQAISTYRELMRNIATKVRPDGGALPAILERWISEVQAGVVRGAGTRPGDPGFDSAVEAKILEVVPAMEGMVHGFDYATVLSAYWRGHRTGNDELKESALRWFRGEFATRTDARQALGVRVIPDDGSWYDYVKLFAKFVASIGYKGLLLLIDEGVNLYKITHSVSREGNYEKLLAMFNDTMQGRAENLGILVSVTPQSMEDPRRGLASYEALRSRLADSRFARDGLRNTSGPVLRLEALTHEEIFLLLNRLCSVHAEHHQYTTCLTADDLQSFMQEAVNRLGADELLTPREIVRDMIGILNLLRENPSVSFGQLIHGPDFKPTAPGPDPDVGESGNFAEFRL